MAHTTPSLVVRHLESSFPKLVPQASGQQVSFALLKGNRGQILAVLQLLDEIPDALLTLADDDHALFVAARAELLAAADGWNAGHTNSLVGLPGYDGNLSPLTIIRNLLKKCPDLADPVPPDWLSFLDDSDLETDLRSDISIVNRAFLELEWKAATVLGGAAIEALLLWAIQRVEIARVERAKNRPAAVDAREWYLYQLIAVAEEVSVISEVTASQCRILKDFRNLIHPGRAMRTEQVCDRGTAAAAIAAIERVVVDLRRWVPR